MYSITIRLQPAVKAALITSTHCHKPFTAKKNKTWNKTLKDKISLCNTEINVMRQSFIHCQWLKNIPKNSVYQQKMIQSISKFN